jgi:glutathione S-transferase
MIILHQFPPCYGLPNASPFCMKVENYLRMAGLPYQSAYGYAMAKAPKGKLPFIEDGGCLVADSGLIIEYLKTRYGNRLDRHLSERERATSLALIRLMDEHLYWAAVIQPLWVEDEGWETTRAQFFATLGGLMRYTFPGRARRRIQQQMRGHGMGRHSRDEIYQLACADLDALSDFLGDRPFFHGERPTTLDATAYAFLANIIEPPIASPAQRHALALQNLVDYCRRMQETYYPGEG